MNQAMGIYSPAYSCACPTPKPGYTEWVAAGRASGIKMEGMIEVDC